MQTQSGAIVDKLLTNVSTGYVPEGYISEKILTPIKVVQTTGKIGNYTNNHLRIVNTVHKGKGPYQRLEALVVDSQTYSIEDHGLTSIITDNDRRNFESPFDARRDTVMALTVAHWLAKEYGLATALTNPAIITAGVTLSGNQQYSAREHADSDPIGDKLTADAAIRAATGRKSNKAIMNEETYDNLRFHHQLLHSMGFKYDRPGGLRMDELAMVLELEEILIGRAVYNNAKEGQADSLAFIWPKDVIYFRGENSPGLMQKTLGYNITKAGTSPREIRRWQNNEPFDSETIACADNYDHMIVQAAAAYLIQDAIA